MEAAEGNTLTFSVPVESGVILCYIRRINQVRQGGLRMARVKAPLFSLDASGQLGEAIVYSKWKGREYVREYTIPQNPNSPTQINVRKAWELLVAKWQGELPAYHLEWDLFANQFKMSGFNQYIGRGMDAYILQITSAVTPVSCSVTGTPPLDVWVWA